MWELDALIQEGLQHRLPLGHLKLVLLAVNRLRYTYRG
jgi:hypothetical protein